MKVVRSGRKVVARICDFTVIQDSREQMPWDFTGFKCDAPHQNKNLIVPVEIAGLKTGDYSLKGFEDRICIERKSLGDLYSTLGQDRDRFEREFERMAQMQYAALIIEADWPTICSSPPERSKLHPKSVFRTLIAWSQRYGVHVHPTPSVGFAERLCFRILERFYLDAMRSKGVNYGEEEQSGEVEQLQQHSSGSIGHQGGI